MSFWSLLFVGLGVAMFLEGLPYLVSPGAVRNYMRTMSEMGDTGMRVTGFALIAAGLAVAWFATR